MHRSIAFSPSASRLVGRWLRASIPLAIAAIVGAALPACHSAAEAQPQAMPPLPVSILRLAEKPIADEDEYLASLTSRRSITLYSQVNGYIRKIPSKPGDRIQQGSLLIEIDP